MNDRLLVDCCTNGGIFLNLNESTTTRGLTKFEGKFQEAEAINKNKRLYPFSVLSENIFGYMLQKQSNMFRVPIYLCNHKLFQ